MFIVYEYSLLREKEMYNLKYLKERLFSSQVSKYDDFIEDTNNLHINISTHKFNKSK